MSVTWWQVAVSIPALLFVGFVFGVAWEREMYVRWVRATDPCREQPARAPAGETTGEQAENA